MIVKRFKSMGLKRVALFFSLCLFFSLLGFPWFFSTLPGREVTLFLVNKFLSVDIQIDSAQISWFGKQRLHHFSFSRKGDSGIFLSAEELSTEHSLWDLLWKRREYRKFTKKWMESAQELSEKIQTRKEISNIPLFSLPPLKKSQIVGGQFALFHQGEREISFANLHVEAGFSEDESEFDFHLEGKTEQREFSGSVRFDIAARGLSSNRTLFLEQRGGRLQSVGDSSLSVLSEIKQLSSKGLDALSDRKDCLWENLFGEQIDLFGQFFLDREHAFGEGKIFSPKVKGTFLGSLEEEHIPLKRAQFNGKLTSKTLKEAFSIDLPFDLEEDLEFQVDVNHCTVPLSLFSFSPNQWIRDLSLEAELTLSPFSLKRETLLSFRPWKASLSTYSGEEQISFSLYGELENDPIPITFSLQSNFSGLFSSKGHISTQNLHGDFLLLADNLSLASFYSWWQKDSPFDPIFWGEGGKFSLEGKMVEGESQLSVELSTDLIQIKRSSLSLNHRFIFLDVPTSCLIRVPEKFLNELEERKGIMGGVFREDLVCVVEIGRGLFSFKSYEAFLKELQLECKLSLYPLSIENVPHLGHLMTDHFQCTLSVDRENGFFLKAQGEVETKEKALFHHLFGLRATFSCEGGGFFQSDGDLLIPQMACQIESESLQMQGSLQKLPEAKINIVDPIQIQATLSPHLFSHFFKKSTWNLIREVPLYLEIEEGEFPFSLEEFYRAVFVKMRAELKGCAIQFHENRLEVPQIKQISLSGEFDGKKSVCFSEIEAQLLSSSGEEAGSLHTRVFAEQCFSECFLYNEQAKWNCSSIWDGISLPVLEKMFHLSPRISPFVGSHLHLEAESLWMGKSRELLTSLNLQTEHLHARTDFAIDDKWILFPREVLSLDWTLTPLTFSHLCQGEKSEKNAIKLVDPVRMQVEMKGGKFSLKQPLTLSLLEESPIEGKFTFGTVALQRGGKNLWIEDNEGKFSLKNLFLEDFFFQWHSFLHSAKEAMEGKIFLRGSAEGFSIQEDFWKNLSTMRGEIEGKSLPLSWICSLLPIHLERERQIEALLGRECDLHLSLEKDGNVNLSFQSENASLEMEGIYREGWLSLRRPMKSTLSLTPLAETLLLPSEIVLKGKEKKISLQIAPYNTYVPLHPFSLDRISIGESLLAPSSWKAVWEGGLESQVQKTLESFSDQKDEKEILLDVQSSPLQFSIKEGIFFCHRVDLLFSDQIHLMVWGKSSLAKKDLNFTFGIDINPLKEKYSLIRDLSDTFPNKEIFVIPVGGSWSTPRIKWKPLVQILSFLEGKKGVAGLTEGKETSLAVGAIFGFAMEMALLRKYQKYFLYREDLPQLAYSLPWEKRE